MKNLVVALVAVVATTIVQLAATSLGQSVSLGEAMTLMLAFAIWIRVAQ